MQSSHTRCTKNIGFLLFSSSLFDATKTTIFKIGKPNYWFLKNHISLSE